jgi:hypothetical protein
MEDDQIPPLIATLNSKRGGPSTRAQAARMLGASGDPRAIEPLLATIEDTGDPYRVPVVTCRSSARRWSPPCNASSTTRPTSVAATRRDYSFRRAASPRPPPCCACSATVTTR